MAVNHLRVVFSVAGGVHGELEILQTVVLGQEGHEGAQGIGRRGGVGEDLGEVGSAVRGRGDAAGNGDGQGA